MDDALVEVCDFVTYFTIFDSFGVTASLSTKIHFSHTSKIMIGYKPPQIMTAQKVDLATQNKRAEEQRISNLLRYSNECQRLEIAARVENQPHLRKGDARSIHEAKKKEEEERRKEMSRQEAIRKIEQEKEEARKQQEALERDRLERDIQRICETSEELKKLEKILKIAYVNKERAAQHQESLLLKHIEEAREELMDDEMEKNRKNLIKQEEEKIQRRRETLVSQKHVLQQQMKESEVSSFLCIYVIGLLV
jgi:hypothetical protein